MRLSSVLLPAVVAGALLVTGCSGGDASKGASGQDCVAPGDASKSIEVKGDVGENLELASETPVEAEELQRSVIEKGKGDAVVEGQRIGVAMTMLNGADGTALQQFPESTVDFAEDSLAPWAYDGIRCAAAGETVALVGTFSDFGADPASLGAQEATAEDAMVVVLKFGEISEAPELLERAEGKEVDPPKDFPTVKLDDEGAPTITMPKGVDAPTKLSVATLIEGEGEEVQPGDLVHVNYRGVIWRTGEEFDSSWSRGDPASFTTDGVIGGFKEALEGQRVGSQVIALVPAEDGGYGAEQLEQMGHEPDDVMVFVLDILGTEHQQ